MNPHLLHDIAIERQRDVLRRAALVTRATAGARGAAPPGAGGAGIRALVRRYRLSARLRVHVRGAADPRLVPAPSPGPAPTEA